LKIEIEVLNMREFTGKLDEAAASVRKAASKEVMTFLLNTESGAKRRCAVRRVKGGRLRSSIHTDIASDLSGSVGTNVFYGPYVEWGTVKMAARPFLHPAFDEEARALPGRLEAAMKEAVGGK
jgi:HK97 gp10 family phage protein